MGKTYSGDKLYFDELSYGISTGVFNDDGKNWDAEYGTGIHAILGIEILPQAYIANEVLDISAILTIELVENYIKNMDLMPLIPEKFRGSLVLQQFVDVANFEVGKWLGLIYGLQHIIDIYNVSDNYIQYLADLIGLTLAGSADAPLAEKRRQLIQAIDWYKQKGTYQSFLQIGYILGISLNVFDLYCSSNNPLATSQANYDAGNFIREPWFVGAVNENPGSSTSGEVITGTSGILSHSPVTLGTVYLTDGTQSFNDYAVPGTLESSISGYSGTIDAGGNWSVTGWAGIDVRNVSYSWQLDSSYFKTPHIDIELFLNRVYPAVVPEIPYPYLFIESMYDSLVEYVEKVRPVNVVPHYKVFLNPVTDETETVYPVDGDILTIAFGPFGYSKAYFDETGSDKPYFDDDDNFFDYTDDSYLRSFSKWKIGTGNKGVSPDTSGFALETIVDTGDVTAMTSYGDRIEYDFEINTLVAIYGLSELGLYNDPADELKLSSTFPDIDLLPGLSLRVKVVLYYTRTRT